jgi:hypothetical protein
MKQSQPRRLHRSWSKSNTFIITVNFQKRQSKGDWIWLASRSTCCSRIIILFTTKHSRRGEGSSRNCITGQGCICKHCLRTNWHLSQPLTFKRSWSLKWGWKCQSLWSGDTWRRNCICPIRRLRRSTTDTTSWNRSCKGSTLPNNT